MHWTPGRLTWACMARVFTLRVLAFEAQRRVVHTAENRLWINAGRSDPVPVAIAGIRSRAAAPIRGARSSEVKM